MTSDAPRIEIGSWDNPFSGSAVAQLESVLPGYITQQRWYRAKTQTIQCISVSDVVQISAQGFILLLDVQYPGSRSNTYMLALVVQPSNASSGSAEPIATFHTAAGEHRHVVNALGEKEFRDALLNAVWRQAIFQGRNGQVRASPTKALDERSSDARPN